MNDGRVSIYEAEIHYRYKVNENQLTSRVFGTFDALGKHDVLIPILTRLAEHVGVIGLASELGELSESESKRIKLNLWKYCGDNYPDVYIKIPSKDRLIVIEVKKNSPTDVEQIIRQYRHARKESERCLYFLLTNDKDKPPEIGIAERRLRKKTPDAAVYWLRWALVWEWLREIRVTLDGVPGKLLEDLISLLEKEQMKNVTGLREEWFTQEMARSLRKLPALCDQVHQIVLELNDRLPDDLQPMYPMPYQQHSESWQKLSPSEQWLHTYLEFTYRDKRWTNVRKPKDNQYLFICFDPGHPEVSVGFYDSRGSEEHVQEIISRDKNMKQLGLKFDHELWADNEGLWISHDFNLDDLKDVTAVDKLLDMITKTRDFINTIDVIRRELGMKGNR